MVVSVTCGNGGEPYGYHSRPERSCQGIKKGIPDVLIPYICRQIQVNEGANTDRHIG